MKFYKQSKTFLESEKFLQKSTTEWVNDRSLSLSNFCFLKVQFFSFNMFQFSESKLVCDRMCLFVRVEIAV